MTQPAAKPTLILASTSARRRGLLREAGVDFEVIPPAVAEPTAPARLPPAARAEALAYLKARSVWDGRADVPVLGADTLVAVGDELLGKPADEADARRMLSRLGGTRHAVITGVAVIWPDGRRRIASARTHVTMRPMTPDELAGYLASGEWVGKAGAYAIQETADRFVVGIKGSWSNVVGLPMELVGEMLRRGP
jgi:septum formation protein